MRRPCLGCGTPIHPSQRRCRPCGAQWERTRGTATQRGYGPDHRRRAKQTIEAQPWCSLCYTTSDLTADHVRSGDPDSEYQTLCRSCNTKKRNAEARARQGR